MTVPELKQLLESGEFGLSKDASDKIMRGFIDLEELALRFAIWWRAEDSKCDCSSHIRKREQVDSFIKEMTGGHC
jgi:hypothetical protein